MKYEELSKSHT